MKQRLAGRNAAITGASSGIGRATAIRLAQEGASVALIARNRERLESVAEEVRAFGVRALVIVADTTVKEQAEAAVAEAIQSFGGLDIFHCNAGIYLRWQAKDLEIWQIRKIMETNFYGTMNCLYAVLPHFLAKGAGTLVTTVSMDGKKGTPPDAAYVATKFALNGFMQVLRQELRGTGVHIATIFPSRTDTPQIAHIDCPKITAKASPDLVARAVVKAIVKKKKEILVPGASCRLMVLADAISPSLGDWMVRTLKLAGDVNDIKPIDEVNSRV